MLLTLCFPRYNQAWLCGIALTPLIAAVWFGCNPQKTSKPSLLRAALLGYVGGLTFFWGVFSWLTTVTVAGWFALPFYLALYPAAWTTFLALARRNTRDFTHSSTNLRLALTCAAAWVASEWLRGLGAISFGWNGLGVALHGNLALIQIAEFTGVGGLSFLVVLVNLILVTTVCRFFNEIRTRQFRPHWDLGFTLALIAAAIAFGAHTVFAPARGDAIPLRVASVQANIPQNEKFADSFADQIRERYAKLTESALADRPQLLLWPEASTPKSLFENETLDFLRGFAERGDTNFLLGSLEFAADEHDYNIAALFTERGDALQIYRKIHLVPFGEYIPFRRSFPPFEWVIGDQVPGDFCPGGEYTVLQLEHPNMKVAALVCFEDTLGDLTRRFVERGAQLLVNVTNDGWFLQSQGPEQHLANAIFRAVENRRPLVRSANTGFTAFIDPMGRITKAWSPFSQGVLTDIVKVPPGNAHQTFYTRHGELFSQACAVVALAAFVALIRQRRKT